MDYSSSDEDVIILACILSEEENQKRKNKKKRIWVNPNNQQREIFGDNNRLFSKLKDNAKHFFQYFRMTYDKYCELLNMLEPALTYQNTRFRASISKEERLAVTLRFLATGDTFGKISRSYRIGQTTVRSIIYSTCEAIWDIMSKIVMPTPTKEAWKTTEEKFRNLWNFPNCLSVIDGKHVLTDRAPKGEVSFFHHRNSFSTILLAIIDADSKFISVDIGIYGIDSVGGAFTSSILGKSILNNELNFPEDKALPGTNNILPHVCLGGESFPSHRNLLRPFPTRKAASKEDMKIFNQRLNKVREVSDNCFNTLVKRFHIYRKHLQISPEKLDRVILATCCLHNFLIDDKCYWTDLDNCSTSRAFENISRIGGSSSGSAKYVRDEFKKYFSSSDTI